MTGVKSFRLAVVSLGATLCLATASQAAILQYSVTIPITATFSNPNPFAGQTYTGTFSADTTTGSVTNFMSNLLGGNFSVASLPAGTASFSGTTVTALHFTGSVTGSDGNNHNFGFTAGFSPGQVTPPLDPNNYFAYLNAATRVQGGGTPSFAQVPEPASFVLLGAGLVVGSAVRRRRNKLLQHSPEIIEHSV